MCACVKLILSTRSASLQHLNTESFRINIRKFCSTILGCYYWNDIPLSIRNKPTGKLFKKYFTSFILLIIDNSNFLYLFTMRLLFLL